eukprot:2135746-Amphidinium_carterae.1
MLKKPRKDTSKLSCLTLLDVTKDLDFSIADPGGPVLVRYSVQNATDADQEVAAAASRNET